jgi:hypothetical protein
MEGFLRNPTPVWVAAAATVRAITLMELAAAMGVPNHHMDLAQL